MEFKMKKPTVCVAMDGDCCCIHQAASFPFNDKYVGKPVCSVCALQCAVSGKGSSGSGRMSPFIVVAPLAAPVPTYCASHLRYRIRIRHRSPTLAA
jgi:hypothetical protein